MRAGSAQPDHAGPTGRSGWETASVQPAAAGLSLPAGPGRPGAEARRRRGGAGVAGGGRRAARVGAAAPPPAAGEWSVRRRAARPARTPSDEVSLVSGSCPASLPRALSLRPFLEALPFRGGRTASVGPGDADSAAQCELTLVCNGTGSL